jgi:hypothetical protein
MRNIMADLFLQDLEKFTSERLVQILSKEKREMFGQEEIFPENRTVRRFYSGSWARPLRKVKQIRSSRWSRRWFEVRNERKKGKQW